MKKITLISAILLTTLWANAQAPIEYLDINNVKAGYLLNGDMFWEPDSGRAAYEFPKGSGIHSNFASALWIGGVERSTNTLKVAAQTYRNSGNDFWPGPLNELDSSYVDSTISANWTQFWKVSRSTIDSFKLLSTHTLANTPKSILEWPAMGNVYARTPTNDTLHIPNRRMAPFIDVNSDNIYNPLDGDYPFINFSDQGIFWVFNDKLGNKQSGSDAMWLEIHAMAYAFNCPALNNVTFLDYSVHNWSYDVYDSTFIGVWSDVDVGNAFDDFIGYDTVSQIGVVYNADTYDEDYTSQSYNARGYEYQLTQHGIILVRGPRVDNPNYPTDPNPFIELEPSSCIYFNNSSNVLGNPVNKQEYYNYLTGRWRDGAFFRLGCDPRNGSGPAYPFVFPNPTVGPISEPACGRTPGDRRMILASGPYELVPGIIPSRVTFAFLNTDRGVDNSNLNALRILADSARNLGCSYWPLNTNSVRKINDIKVFPNPTSDFVNISSELEIERVEIFDLAGRKLMESGAAQISTSELSNGFYILKVFSKSEFGVTKFEVNK